MGRRPLKTQDSEGFLRAFTDEWADLESTYGVYLQMRCTPASRRGLLEFRVSCWSDREDRSTSPQAAFSWQYPTAQVLTLEASFFQALGRVARILEQQRRYPEGKG